jgi:hypothetical protein
MGISKKGKRKTIVEGRSFVWWVFEEIDQTEFDGIQVKVVAEDQSLYLKYGLQQNESERYLVMTLKDHTSKIHVRCPKFEDDNGIITSSGIVAMVNWAKLSPSEVNRREICHAYSEQYGILHGTKIMDAYDKIIENLHQT